MTVGHDVPERVPGPEFLALLWAEYTKLATVRSTVVWLAAVMLGGASLGAAAAVSLSAWHAASAAGSPWLEATVITSILGVAAPGVQLALCVLAVLTIAGEYETGMILASGLVVPRRTLLLAAKTVVLDAAAFVGAALAAAAALFGAALVNAGVRLPAADTAAARAVLFFGLRAAVAMTLALALALLVQRADRALLVTLITVVVVPDIAHRFPGQVEASLLNLLPAGDLAGQYWLPGTQSWQALGIQCAGTLAVLGLSAIRLCQRDVSAVSR